MIVRVCCPAKVNLHLEVLGRRGDGFHELRTVFAAVGLWDTLEVRSAPRGEWSLDIEPAGALAEGGENLVSRAARMLQARFDCRDGAAARLRKAIPVGGGLGGGSSNAAGALVALARLWGLPAGAGDLMPLAAELGSDVPFFLIGGVCWGVGRGDELVALPDLPAWWAVLAPGREGAATAEVYGRLQAPPLGSQPRTSELAAWLAGKSPLPLDRCRNDLAAAAMAVTPRMAGPLAVLRQRTPLLAQVSGSGSTVFGVFAGEAAARAAAAALAPEPVMAVPVLGRCASQPHPMLGED